MLFRSAAKSDAERLAVLKGVAPQAATSAASAQAQYVPPPPSAPVKDDRSIVAAAGGLAALNNASTEELPPETGPLCFLRADFPPWTSADGGVQRGTSTGTRRRTRCCGLQRHR